MLQKTGMKVIKSKNNTFIDDLIVAVHNHFEKERKQIAKDYYKNTTELKEALEELDIKYKPNI